MQGGGWRGKPQYTPQRAQKFFPDIKKTKYTEKCMKFLVSVFQKLTTQLRKLPIVKINFPFRDSSAQRGEGHDEELINCYLNYGLKGTKNTFKHLKKKRLLKLFIYNFFELEMVFT